MPTGEAFPFRESGGNISTKTELLSKSKNVERTGKIMDLVSQRLLQHDKNVNAMEVKETAKSAEQIFGDLFCQLLRGVPDDEITNVQQILLKAKYQAKSREMQNAPYTSSFNVTPTYGLVPPSQPYLSSIQSPTFN